MDDMFTIVGTSIGNIKDTSMRAAETLALSDVILAEDTRTFSTYYTRLLKLYNLTPRKDQSIRQYHTQNEFEEIPEILSMLKDGLNVSLVSESGMPLISDPGRELLRKVIQEGIEYTVIPGPTAYATALVHSAAQHTGTLFAGFFPKKKSRLIPAVRTIVGYESPHRINKTLRILSEIAPDCRVTLCRELTKKYEEIDRGTPSELADKKYKGEITLVIEM